MMFTPFTPCSHLNGLRCEQTKPPTVKWFSSCFLYLFTLFTPSSNRVLIVYRILQSIVKRARVFIYTLKEKGMNGVNGVNKWCFFRAMRAFCVHTFKKRCEQVCSL